MEYVGHGVRGSWSTWVVQYVGHAVRGSCSTWVMQYVGHAVCLPRKKTRLQEKFIINFHYNNHTPSTPTPGTCCDVSQSHYEPIIHCSLVVPRLAVVRGSLVLGTGLGVSPSPWGWGHSRKASLGTHHWAWLHMGALHPAHSGASSWHSPHPHRWVHHAWM